jgi:hypothetical protein
MKNSFLNNKKVVAHARRLIARLNSKTICKDIHNEVVNFCTIVLSENPKLYKKINIEFSDFYEPINLIINNYSKKNKSKRKVVIPPKNSENIALLSNDVQNILERIIKIYRLKEALEK